MGKKLPLSYYENEDTLSLAQDLLGKVIVSHVGGCTTAGIIVETEAYCGSEDKACHAYQNRRTKRTEPMYSKGGVSISTFVTASTIY